MMQMHVRFLSISFAMLFCVMAGQQLIAATVNLNSGAGGEKIGDPGWVFDSSKADSNYPDMEKWASAGVRGGIPYRSSTPIKQTINTGTDNLQSAIDAVASSGGGVVLLRSGTYTITNPVNLKSNVTLRGETGNPKDVTINVTFRQKWEGWSSKRYGIVVTDASKAGIEDLTLFYYVPGLEPNNGASYTAPWSQGCMNNDVDRDDLYVGLVKFAGTTSDSWVDNCRLLESGTDPILTENSTKHLTFRGNLVDRAYNKGSRGTSYFDMRGQYILVTGNTCTRIRHVAIEQGAQYVVVYDNYFEVDVNFHSRDRGHNLVEKNTIRIPEWHRHSATHDGWEVFDAGNPGTHSPSGDGNRMLNNVTDLRDSGPRYGKPGVVYKTDKYEIATHSKTPPSGGTLYAIKRQ